MSTQEDREHDFRNKYGWASPLDPFAQESAVLADRFGPVGEVDMSEDEPEEEVALLGVAYPPGTLEVDAESVEIDIPEPDELDESDAVDLEDRIEGFIPAGHVEGTPTPEFADYPVWCPESDDWAAAWRPAGEPDAPWFCRNCGNTDHRFKDHEGAGA